MPINKYFKGHGDEVMNSMMRGKSEKEGKREFYATANKMGMNPGEKGLGAALLRSATKKKGKKKNARKY